MEKNNENRKSKMVITVTDEGVGFDIAGTGADIMKNFSRLIPAIYKTVVQMDGPEHSECENCEDSEGCEDKGKFPKSGVKRADAVMAMSLSYLMAEIPQESYFAKKGENRMHELLTGFIMEDVLGGILTAG